MSEGSLSNFYETNKRHSHARTNILKFAMMPFAFFVILWLPDKIGYISTYSNFVAPVFFILFGFYTLAPDKTYRIKKLKKALSRSFKYFVIMFVCFIALNIIDLAYMGSLQALLSGAFLRKRTLFNFLVLNVWPFSFGQSIWFVQSLVYAYLFFLIAEKTKLCKFYFPILIILSAFALATGEFAAFFGFPYLGYPYIPSGALTRAIPYMLIGMYLRENVDSLEKIRSVFYLALFPVGLIAAFVEIEILSYIGKLAYAGHTIGFGIMALSLCCYAIATPKNKNNYFSRRGNRFSRSMYMLCEPIAFLVLYLTYFINPSYLFYITEFKAIISLIICFAMVYIFNFLKHKKWFNGFKEINNSWKKFRRRIKSEKRYLKHKIRKKFRKYKR